MALILLVEDSAPLRKGMARILASLGHVVEEAGDGTEALSKLETIHPKLIISDWNMPNMDGGELLKTLRDRGDDVLFGYYTTEDFKISYHAKKYHASFVMGKVVSREDVMAVLAGLGSEIV